MKIAKYVFAGIASLMVLLILLSLFLRPGYVDSSPSTVVVHHDSGGFLSGLAVGHILSGHSHSTHYVHHSTVIHHTTVHRTVIHRPSSHPVYRSSRPSVSLRKR